MKNHMRAAALILLALLTAFIAQGCAAPAGAAGTAPPVSAGSEVSAATTAAASAPDETETAASQPPEATAGNPADAGGLDPAKVQAAAYAIAACTTYAPIDVSFTTDTAGDDVIYVCAASLLVRSGKPVAPVEDSLFGTVARKDLEDAETLLFGRTVKDGAAVPENVKNIIQIQGGTYLIPISSESIGAAVAANGNPENLADGTVKYRYTVTYDNGGDQAAAKAAEMVVRHSSNELGFVVVSFNLSK